MKILIFISRHFDFLAKFEKQTTFPREIRNKIWLITEKRKYIYIVEVHSSSKIIEVFYQVDS